MSVIFGYWGVEADLTDICPYTLIWGDGLDKKKSKRRKKKEKKKRKENPEGTPFYILFEFLTPKLFFCGPSHQVSTDVARKF